MHVHPDCSRIPEAGVAAGPAVPSGEPARQLLGWQTCVEPQVFVGLVDTWRAGRHLLGWQKAVQVALQSRQQDGRRGDALEWKELCHGVGRAKRTALAVT